MNRVIIRPYNDILLDVTVTMAFDVNSIKKG